MIQIKNLDFKYRNKLALDDISINIKDGDSVAIIGPNGSGKSTLLKILNGIATPSSGKYYFDGEEITEKKLNDNVFSKRFHKKIGFVFQNPDTQLFCSTVFEEIAFGPRQMGFSEEEVTKRVNDCLQILNLDKIKDEAPYNISGGEKKRVAIASILSINPSVLTLDEPLGGIDPKGKKFLTDLMIKLSKAGKTIICVTHDFEYVEGVFKRAIVLSDEHKVIRDDTFESVISDIDFLKTYNIK